MHTKENLSTNDRGPADKTDNKDKAGTSIGVASSEYRRIGRLPRRELETMLVRGDTPDPEKLAGFEFRGMNTAMYAKFIGIQKFIKGFFKGDGGVSGYNIPVVQNGLDAPWIPRGKGEPKRFGFYSVDRVDAGARDNAYLHALLLDYGKANGRVDPTQFIRDYLVRVNPGSDELLLGKAYIAVGPAPRVAVGYFLLERHRPSSFRR
jgi:hypothetical protein